MPLTVDSKSTSPHNTWLEIRKSHLLHNLKSLYARCPAGTRALAVVKANAYGHGLRETAAVLDQKVHFFGVASLREALELIDAGLKTPPFIFGRLSHEELPVAVSQPIVLSVSSYAEALEISQSSQSLKKKTPVHIKVDTGMGRLGIPFREAVSTIERIWSLEGLAPEGLYTHLPSAESDTPFTERQLRDFSMLVKALTAKDITFCHYHATNSAGTLTSFSEPLNTIRPGLLLYGIYPDLSLNPLIKVLPALSLKSRIIFTKRLKPGESSGYGRKFITDKPVTIGILPIGYSHGYPFSSYSKAQVLYRGKRYPLAGRISMDYLTVNFGEDPVQIRDEVTLIGSEGDTSITVEEIAQWAHTIPYEIVTRLASNLQRFFK